MDNNPKDSRNKSHSSRFWVLLLVVSILLGTTAALLPLAFPNTLQIDDFELHNMLGWTVIYSCVFFLFFLTFIFIVKRLRVFFRWLFSWRNIKRCLIAFVLLAFLVALFYAEED